MRVIVSLDQRFEQTPDRKIWTQSPFSYPFWRRYLDAFDEVRVLARALSVPRPAPGSVAVEGDGVRFWVLPFYLGPAQFLRRIRAVRRSAREAVGESDAVIFRLSSPIADLVQPWLIRQGRPYGVEVLGDPHDVYAPGGVRHPLSPFFRVWFSRRLRTQCAKAAAAAYVTKWTLQKRYPPGGEGSSWGISDLELDAGDFAAGPREFREPPRPVKLVLVGSLQQLYKGPDVLLEALGECETQGLDFRLTVLGDGRYRPMLEARARALGIVGKIRFVGQVPAGAAVSAHLDEADLFILPSLAEGLPRALVEAMARGLPCIASQVGGIPELLPAEAMVPTGNPSALASKILEVASDTGRLSAMSARNLETAREYHAELLCDSRRRFYQYLRAKTEEWLRA